MKNKKKSVTMKIDADAKVCALVAASKKMLAFYKDLANSNPGFLALLVLQDYQRWHEAIRELPKAIKDCENL